jgi:uncharacterized membrane protein YphA (DoxX/SURF4 family)
MSLEGAQKAIAVSLAIAQIHSLLLLLFCEPPMREQKNLGLLILRGAGFLLVFTFGIQKISWYVIALHAGKSLSSVGLAPLIAKMGFPFSVVLGVWVTFNESIGAFLIGCGFLTRLMATSAALGMAGALYTSVRLGEDWLRAALYLIIFTALILTGPGKFSVDHLFNGRKNPRTD